MKLAVAAFVAACAFAAPAGASAADASLTMREVPLHGARALASAATPRRFDLVGLHWRGRGTVLFSTRSIGGRWSRWHVAAPEAEDLPDAGSVETVKTRGWRLGNPYWTGPADAIRYRLRGDVRRLRAYFVRSSAERLPLRRLEVAGSPVIVPRAGWNANESIRREAPKYASALHFALVHHTAGSNNYGPGQSAAIVRAIELYHVEGNGWNDIGYNFLVDKYGQVFEGRYGGMQRAVIGAHAQGFNTGSVGVALIGNYGSRAPSAAAQKALANLLAWRLDVAHIDPRSSLTWISGGNPRFPAGTPVFLRAISGHRDTGFTECPGYALYRRLPAIAKAVAATGLPKLYAPAVKGSVPGLVRFTGRLTAMLPWTVTVTDAAGSAVATGSGVGTNIAWTWDASAAPKGRYFWMIGAGPGVRPATGGLGGAKQPPFSLTGLTATPEVVTPNGDGVDDSSTISYTLNAPATVTASLLDLNGTTVATLFDGTVPAGPQAFLFSADTIPDGLYQIAVTATNVLGVQVTGSVYVTVTRTTP
ncbi:MAG TPA: N-acetylmuramoyl-L-alanine amidase [Gaiellaceae bacterium]